MSSDGKRKGLGRGLSALLGDDSEDTARLERLRAPQLVPIERLRPGRFQPRRHLREDELAELAQSIAEKGVLQPILVRRRADDAGAFEIIAGERRWRAAQMAQVHEVPVLVKDLTDREALEIALIENVQRQDLSPLDEAEGYRRLVEEFGHTQEDLAKSIGKSRSHVANTLRLLSLPDTVKTMLDAGALTAGHARALLGAGDPEALARAVAKRGLNVRQTERLVAGHRGAAPRAAAGAESKDVDTAALERDLSALLGLPVGIRFQRGAGTVTLHYRTLDQLDEILQRLTQRTRAMLAASLAAAFSEDDSDSPAPLND